MSNPELLRRSGRAGRPCAGRACAQGTAPAFRSPLGSGCHGLRRPRLGRHPRRRCLSAGLAGSAACPNTASCCQPLESCQWDRTAQAGLQSWIAALCSMGSVRALSPRSAASQPAASPGGLPPDGPPGPPRVGGSRPGIAAARSGRKLLGPRARLPGSAIAPWRQEPRAEISACTAACPGCCPFSPTASSPLRARCLWQAVEQAHGPPSAERPGGLLHPG